MNKKKANQNFCFVSVKRRLWSFAILMLFMNYCYAQVVINEIQSSNSSTIRDNFGEYEDWIELYNPNDFAVDVAGLVFKDQADIWPIPSGDTLTKIPPKGYLLFWADDEEPEGTLHTNFKLSAKDGEFLGLYQSDSVTLIESVNFPPLSDDRSYGKCDVNGWVVFNKPTPLKENDCVSGNQDKSNRNGFLICRTLAKGEVSITLPSYTETGIELYLYTLDGKTSYHQRFYANPILLNVTDLKAQMYILTIQTRDKWYHEKIVVTGELF